MVNKSSDRSKASKVRICAAVSTTQLLSLIHILRNQPEDNCRDVLLWYSYDGAIENRRMMREVIKSYEFTADYELVGLKVPTPRESGPLLWPLQSLLRHRHDANRIRALLAPHLRAAASVEVWTDEPIHFPMRFLHGLFPEAEHVKFPHGFDLEDASCASYRQRTLDKAAAEVTRARRLFWHAIRLGSGVRYDLDHGLQFDKAFTFGVPSPWSKDSINVSRLIDSEEMRAIYLRLPLSLRNEIEEKVRAASGLAGQPWALLLLFGLDENLRKKYMDAIRRVYRERPETFSGLQLVVKPHPVNRNDQPGILVEELSQALGREVTLFDCTLNLDILWSVVPAKLVMAGPCGALPTIRRLGETRAVILREILESMETFFPEDKQQYELIAEGFEVW